MSLSRRHSTRTTPPPRPADTRQAQRVLHLDHAIRKWLDADADHAARERLLGASVLHWLRSAGDGPLFERLPALVAQLQASFPAARECNEAAFDSAFAATLLQQAFADVAREASRSGRAEAFVCLKPYLQQNPSPPEIEQLAQALALTPQAIELALASMRRRLRGRIEAALDLWSDSPDSRDTLRRHMRAALTESTP